jgi:dihydrofolate synthase/folylpolyglutamate synthase
MAHTDSQYRDTLDYLFSRLPMFSRIGAAAMKADLSNTLRLCEALGNPQDRFKSVHIAGTNGKGSTSHGIASVLQSAGYKTGLYTSPHLVDFRERIRIDGAPVSKGFVVEFTERIKALVEDIQPSFFELTVAMAFCWFAEQEVDIAVIETGLGGRLDSTNIITPVLSVITNIGFDHTDLLGNTLPLIAAEKAGIIKSGIPVVVGRIQEETRPVFEEHAIRNGSAILFAADNWSLEGQGQKDRRQLFSALQKTTGKKYQLETDLAGSYQQENLATILTATEQLSSLGWDLSIEVALKALGSIGQRTGLRGRYEILSSSPRVIADVAHNADGLAQVLPQFEQEAKGRKHIVAGFVRDKDVSAALAMFPKDALYYWCNAAIPRALPVAELAESAITAGLSGQPYPSVEDALKAALTDLKPDDALLITGSFFIVGDALQAWEALQPVPAAARQ